jgi:hypothetical protein
MYDYNDKYYGHQYPGPPTPKTNSTFSRNYFSTLFVICQVRKSLNECQPFLRMNRTLNRRNKGTCNVINGLCLLLLGQVLDYVNFSVIFKNLWHDRSDWVWVTSGILPAIHDTFFSYRKFDRKNLDRVCRETSSNFYRIGKHPQIGLVLFFSYEKCWTK